MSDKPSLFERLMGSANKKVDENKTTAVADTKEAKTKAKGGKDSKTTNKEIVTQENLYKDLQLKSAVDIIKVLSIKK